MPESPARAEPELLTIAVTVVFIIIGLLFFYLDPGGIYAGAALTIVVSVVTLYLSIKFDLFGSNKPAVPSAFVSVPRRYRFPPVISFIFLISILLIFENLLLSGFQEALIETQTNNRALEVFNGGELFFGSLLPLSAAWASKIGFRDRSIRLREVFIATVITFGVIAGMTATVAAIRGFSPIEAILRQLFHASIFPLPLYGRWFMVALTVALGIMLVLFFGVWLWTWSRYGHWRFTHQYAPVP